VPAPPPPGAFASVRKPAQTAFRIGGRVVTQDGFFAKVVGLSKGAPLVLALDVAGIGRREGVPAELVTPSDRRSMPLSPRPPRGGRTLSPAPRVPATVAQDRRRRAEDMPPSDAGCARSRAACSEGLRGADGAKSLDTSLEEETERFKQTSEALDSILSENSRLQCSLEAERNAALGSPIKDSATVCLDSQPAQAQTAAVALSFSPAKRPSVPALTLSGLLRSDVADPSTAPNTMSDSASRGCLSPRLASTMGEHRLHLQESAYAAETIGRTVGSISKNVSSWKEEIERDRREQEEWRRNRLSSPRTPRATSSPRVKNQIAPQEPRDGTTSHGPPGPRTPRSPRFLQTKAPHAPAASLADGAARVSEATSTYEAILPSSTKASSRAQKHVPAGHAMTQSPVGRQPRAMRQLEASLSTPPRSLAAHLRAHCPPSMTRALSLESPFRARCMSPGGDLTSRVKRCALIDFLDKGRTSSTVIYCFDAWRMLMYCRVQHELGQQETISQQLQHASDVALYQQQMQELHGQIQEEREHFQRKQNEERELFMQMIAMLTKTNAQLQSSMAELQHTRAMPGMLAGAAAPAAAGTPMPAALPVPNFPAVYFPVPAPVPDGHVLGAVDIKPKLDAVVAALAGQQHPLETSAAEL
jgi:hypothetical protein